MKTLGWRSSVRLLPGGRGPKSLNQRLRLNPGLPGV